MASLRYCYWRLIHKPPEKSVSGEPDGPSIEVSSQFLRNPRMARVIVEGQQFLPFCFVVCRTAKSTRRSRCGMRL